MIDQVRALILEQGLQEMAEQILHHLHECIYVEPTAAVTHLLGASRLGGNPDLPAGWSYPVFHDEPLVFIGQLNLEEIQSIGVPNELPQRGLLYFFMRQLNSPYTESWQIGMGGECFFMRETSLH